MEVNNGSGNRVGYICMRYVQSHFSASLFSPEPSITRIAWAAFINTVSSNGLPDIVLTIITLAFFSFGFILGLFEIGRIGGIILLGITGGLAFGIRIVLLRDGLLFQGNMGVGDDTVLDGSPGLFSANWAIIAVLGAVGGLTLIWWQRINIVRVPVSKLHCISIFRLTTNFFCV